MSDQEAALPFINPTREQLRDLYGLPANKPVCMLNLLKFKTGLATTAPAVLRGADVYGLYSDAAREAFRASGGKVVWIGQPKLMLIGPTAEVWDLAFVAVYPTPSSFIGMVESEAYQQVAKFKTMGVEDSRLIVCAGLEPGASLHRSRTRLDQRHEAAAAPPQGLHDMKLVGMLDSPYVRRVAVTLQLLGLCFEHESLSVFGGQASYSRINPVLKAPTLVCTDGTVLMDSSLIILYAERVAGRSLLPDCLEDAQRVLRLVGLAMAAAEKAVQLVYEDAWRPAEKRHQPWVDRMTQQLRAACTEIERELQTNRPSVDRALIAHGGVAIAVAWRFIQAMLPAVIDPAHTPALRLFSEQAEELPEFVAAPHGVGVFPVRAA